MSYVLYTVIALLMVKFVYLVIRYINRYKLCMVFGAKGSGKTTFLTKTAIQHMRRGKEVYSTVYVPGAHLFDVKLVGQYTFPPESVVLIDEVGMIWDNRDYKNFRTDVRDWFKLQRHYHVKVYLFSQTFDIDVKLRNLTDEMYLCRPFMNFISIARRIKRWITVVHPSGDSEARIVDDIDFVPMWQCILGAKPCIFTYIPGWTRYFDSFEVPPLPVIPSVFQEIPEGLSWCLDRRRWYRVFSCLRVRCVALYRRLARHPFRTRARYFIWKHRRPRK